MVLSWGGSCRRQRVRNHLVVRCFSTTAAVLLLIGSLLSIRDAGGPPSLIAVASANVQRSEQTSPRYSSKPIRDIQPIADRVLADNPETPGQAPSDFGEFDRESWRIVRLEVPKPDGEWMRVTLARPLTWLETAGRDDHGRLWLEFKELGIANWANVLTVEPCPEAAVGQGRLVTGKFEHSSAEVIDLFVDGVSEPIGTTSNHPFWSEDRRDFVQAGKLRIGERLRLHDGSTPVVTAVVPRSQSVRVFNLEVDGEHVYYVAASGVLVHNGDEEYVKKWYHGTTDAQTLTEVGPNARDNERFGSTGPDGAQLDDRGLFLTPDRDIAQNYADDQAGWRGGGRQPIVLEAEHARIQHLLEPIDGAYQGEMMIPKDRFPEVGPDIFRPAEP